MINRYIKGEELKQPRTVRLPDKYIEPIEGSAELAGTARVDMEEATREACRCMRCDLEFTKPHVEEEMEEKALAAGDESA